MNELKKFIDDLGRIPIIPLIGNPGAKIIGKSLKDCLTNAETQASALVALYKEIQPDGMFAMMDLTVEAEYLGCELIFNENDPPAVLQPAFEKIHDIEKLFANKNTGGRMPLFAEVIEKVKRVIDVPICAYVIGPFTLAGQIMNLGLAMKSTRKSPKFLHMALKECSRIIIEYIKLLEDAGVDLVCILEPSAMMISGNHFNEFSGQYCEDIISKGISRMSVLHICGDTNHLIPEMLSTKPDGLSLDKQVNLADIQGTINDGTVLIGNIDPVGVLTFSDPKTVEKESVKIIDSMKEKGNFIFSTGCDVPQEAPLENLKAMMSVKNI